MSERATPQPNRDAAAGVTVRRRRSATQKSGDQGQEAATGAANRAARPAPRNGAAAQGLAPRPSAAATSPAEPASHAPRWLAAGTQVLLAALCWLALAAVVYATDPENAVFRAAFFLLLFGAIAFTLMPILHALMLRLSHSRIFQEQSGTIAARQSVMLAAFVVLNALLQMLRVWTGLTALLLLGMFAVIEIVALARR